MNLPRRLGHWNPVDWAVAVYTAWIGILVTIRARNVPEWPWLAGLHAAVLAILLLLPPRGSAWETAKSGKAGARRIAHAILRFLRHAYPLPVVLIYFEEVRFTVDAIYPDSYWFEPRLYAVDRALFGTLPAIAWADLTSPILDEIAHAFYFSYYPILAGGLLFAWHAGSRSSGPGRGRPATPGPAFAPTLTAMTYAFLICYLPYPWLPARGPWENPGLMAQLPEFGGLIFTPLVQTIIHHGAVPGGCFPSVHVAGAWGLIVGLAARRRRAAWILAAIATGMTFSCAYTRYHHGVDLPAGLAVGLVGGTLGRWLARPVGDGKDDPPATGMGDENRPDA